MHFKFIRIIAKQEWLSIFRIKTPLALYSVLLALMLLATFTGWQYVNTFNKQQAQAREEVHDHWMNQPNRHPHRVAHYGYLVFREKSPLSFFDFGLDSYVGNSVFLEAHRQNTVNMSEAGFSNGMLRFGQLSMASVFQLLIPLFIIFIGFQTIAGLKQNGVLKILLCQRASYYDILIGKTLGLAAVSWALFLPLLFTALIGGVFLLNGNITPQTGLNIGILLFSYGLYLFIISMMVVAVSALSSSGANSLVVSVLIWILCFVIIPKGAQTLGNYLFQAPDKIAFEHSIEEEISKEGDSHNPDDPHFAELKNKTLKKYGVDSVQNLPVNYGALVMQEGENISSGIFNRHFDQLIKTYKAQNSIATILGFLDPYLAMRNVSMSISGVDFETFSEFQKQTEHYRFNKTKNLNEIHLTQIDYKNDRDQKVGQSNWQQMAEFSFKPFSLSQTMKNSLWGFISLILWTLSGFFVLQYISTLRKYQL
ncbi:ABC-2 type transport system permease protein [Dyadobacter koreensis]|uniref:ABC-2 type transport system permease protein n=1 Tax=Dyadobacter koreensis TaxID=408657 RepID=A0A1H6Q8H9_9BACT|nr:DUF3526 domain-containing protein [Dyadobacter koreensis]SEI37134.1 ABC-2 type transport system permease protein [Dyadobacter koreensis]